MDGQIPPQAHETPFERSQPPVERDVAGLLLEEAPEALIALSPEGTVLYWNQGAQKLFGHRSDDALGHAFADLLPQEAREQARQALARVSTSGESSFQVSYRDERAPRLLVDTALRAVRDSHGELRL